MQGDFRRVFEGFSKTVAGNEKNECPVIRECRSASRECLVAFQKVLLKNERVIAGLSQNVGRGVKNVRGFVKSVAGRPKSVRRFPGTRRPRSKMMAGFSKNVTMFYAIGISSLH